jgi:hypothetical protein
MKRVVLFLAALVSLTGAALSLRAEVPGAFAWYQEGVDSAGRLTRTPVKNGDTVRPMKNGNVTLWLEAYDPDKLRRVSLTTPTPNTGTMTFIDGATRVYVRYGWKATAGQRTWTGSLRDALGNTYQTSLTLNVVL